MCVNTLISNKTMNWSLETAFIQEAFEEGGRVRREEDLLDCRTVYSSCVKY